MWFVTCVPLPTAWLSHVASILICRCVQSALAKSCDYRERPQEANWAEVIKEVAMPEDDLKLVWLFIKKEVS